MPSFPIIDSHVHLYDPARIDYPWMADMPALNQPHGLDRFAELTEGVAVDGLVFVEVDAAAGRHLEEVRWVEDHAAGSKMLRGMVAAMPLEKGAAVEPDLAELVKLPHARGVRRLIERHQDEPGWALRSDFVDAVRLLPRYGLTFDLCLKCGQFADVIALVRQCPDVRFVIDHIAKPDIRIGVEHPWREQMREIAREPNILCKVSGVVTEADHANWTFEQVRPFIAHAIDCFGFDRIMFGGDWPVSELATSYARWVETTDRIVAGASADELHKFYRGNAIDFYRL